MLIIGLGNKARQGKNYVANYMQEALSVIKQYSFAEELKLYCKEHHNELEPKWQLAHQTKQKPGWKDDPIYGCTPILQWYGTEVARKENPNVWVDAVAARIEKDQPEAAIITDVRFPNEAEFVAQNGGYLVQVIRIKDDGTQYLDPGRDPNHPSEIALDDYNFDYYIRVKDGDLNALKSKSLGVLSNCIKAYAEVLTDNAAFDSLPDSTGHSLTDAEIEDGWSIHDAGVVMVSPKLKGSGPRYHAEITPRNLG